MGDHGEVVEWLELVCMSANVLCWLSLESAPLPIKGTPQVVQVGAPKPTTQPKRLARARPRPHSKSKRSPNQIIRDQSKAHANQSIRSARTKNVKSQNFHSKSHGYKCGMHQRSPNREEVAWVAWLEVRHPLSIGVTFGSRPGVGGSNPVNTWFLELCFLQQQGLQRR